MGLIHTDATTLTKVQGSAVGIQPKCYDNGYWYKRMFMDARTNLNILLP